MPSASRALIVLALLLHAPALSGQNVRLLVQSAPLAGLRHYAATELKQELRIGDRLELERESANVHDANAIAVMWRGRKLGYLPRRDNATLAWALDRGEHLRARISRLAQPNPAGRIEIEVFME